MLMHPKNVIVPFPKDKAVMKKIIADFKEVVESQMKARLSFRKFHDDFEKVTRKQ
jgi:hypothetical protein